MTNRAENYRAKAADCEKRAQEARDATMKQVMEDVARSWIRLAMFVDEGACHQPSTFARKIPGGHRSHRH